MKPGTKHSSIHCSNGHQFNMCIHIISNVAQVSLGSSPKYASARFLPKSNKPKSLMAMVLFAHSPSPSPFSGIFRTCLAQESVHHHRSQWVAWQNTKALVHRWSRGVNELIQLWRPEFFCGGNSFETHTDTQNHTNYTSVRIAGTWWHNCHVLVYTSPVLSYLFRNVSRTLTTR